MSYEEFVEQIVDAAILIVNQQQQHYPMLVYVVVLEPVDSCPTTAAAVVSGEKIRARSVVTTTKMTLGMRMMSAERMMMMAT